MISIIILIFVDDNDTRRTIPTPSCSRPAWTSSVPCLGRSLGLEKRGAKMHALQPTSVPRLSWLRFIWQVYVLAQIAYFTGCADCKGGTWSGGARTAPQYIYIYIYIYIFVCICSIFHDQVIFHDASKDFMCQSRYAGYVFTHWIGSDCTQHLEHVRPLSHICAISGTKCVMRKIPKLQKLCQRKLVTVQACSSEACRAYHLRVCKDTAGFH